MPLHIGILGCYPQDFARLRAVTGITLHYIERDRPRLRLPANLDAILYVTRFVNHNHWKQLRRNRNKLIPIQGGWSAVNKAIQQLSTGAQP